MSVLETPRICFRGEISWDPITTNNYPNIYDENVAELLFGASESVQQFREQAVEDVLTIRSWNPQGTHRSAFFDSSVCSTDTGGGVATTDPFVGSPANFIGMLVDSEPYGAYSSQLFFDSIRFGVDGGYRIFAPRTDRVTSRYVNFFRYLDNATSFKAGVASVNWQTSFPKETVEINPFDSPALIALLKAMDAPDVAGLVVRWNTYRTIYYDDPTLNNAPGPANQAAQGLIDKLKAGGFQPNPARSMMVGAIGLWRPDEPRHEPGERALIANEFPTGQGNPTVASAPARLDGNRLTVDLSNSISETGPDLAKQNLGTLHFVAASADGQTVKELGAIDYGAYDRDAYETGSGIVTLDADPDGAAFAADNDIQLRNDDGKGHYGTTVYLSEQALRAIPSDPNLYINENDSVTTDVRVYDRGVPAGAGISVNMVGGPSATISTIVPTGVDGIAPMTYSGPQFGAVEGFVLLPGTDPALPAAIDPLVTTYMYIRTLPLDADIAALEPSWDNVYAYVLCKWQALAPCMDNWLDLGNEAQVRAYGPLIKQLTDPANLELYRYMPVTRDMTAGERTLLYNFLDGKKPGATESVAAAASAPAASENALTRLSRSMRGG
jgi:hypothetical protein